MKHHNSEGFGPPAPDLVSPQGGLPCTGCSAAVALSGHFTHVRQSLKSVLSPLHLVFGGYYFSIASKIGADRRVMGIALAIKPLQGWSGFLSAPNDLYPCCPVDQGR